MHTDPLQLDHHRTTFGLGIKTIATAPFKRDRLLAASMVITEPVDTVTRPDLALCLGIGHHIDWANRVA